MMSYFIFFVVDIWDYISESMDVIVVDEVQFFDEEIIEVLLFFVDKGYCVIVVGFDMDFRGELFGVVLSIMVIVESVMKL